MAIHRQPHSAKATVVQMSGVHLDLQTTAAEQAKFYADSNAEYCK